MANGKDVGDIVNRVVHLTGAESSALVDAVQTWRYKVDSRQHGFFLARKRSVNAHSMIDEDAVQRPASPSTPGMTLGFTWEIGCLVDYERGFFDDIAAEDQYVSFADPSTYPEYPGWMLRNLLVLVRRRWKLEKIQILCYRDIQRRRDDANSIVLQVGLLQDPSTTPSRDILSLSASDMPKVTGWERNGEGRVMNRIANLGEYMDPRR